MNKKERYFVKYKGDTRYEKVWEQMQLLSIEDVTTDRQGENGTITWRLPIKNEWKNGSFIEVGSFKSGYVRNNNSCSTNYQLNKRKFEDEYFQDYEWKNGEQVKIKNQYRKWSRKTCKLIPIEIDRLEYLISYCLKNYYIKHANFVANGDYIPKWRYDNLKDKYKKLDDFYEASADFNNSMLEGMVPKWKYDERLTNCGHHDRINALECSNETWKNLADEWKERFENLDDTSDSQEVMIKSLENKLNEANDTLLGDCKYIYPEGRYDKIKDLESKNRDLENKLDTIQRIADYGQTE